MENTWNGIILIDKAEGETSHDVVKQIRRILKQKQVGHAGTLDPFATGLLVILLGQGTKISPYLMSMAKKYRATMRLGIETDTLDLEGRIVHTNPVPALLSAEIKAKARGFIGEIEQIPPAFSAVRSNGKRAYHLARKGIQPILKSRRVKVHSFEIISTDLPDVTFEVECSSGTYIRSLAADLGRQLGPGAHLTALRRLSSGPFAVVEAIRLKGNNPCLTYKNMQERILPLSRALPHLRGVDLNDGLALKIRHGYMPRWEELWPGSDVPDIQEGFLKLLNAGNLVAITEIHASCKKRLLKLRRVFH
jgi:tRNA pseudouridine55 synthase